MVYCGKPSKSCGECRKRDIKCDKRRDSCSQCKRACLVCPGYPNPENLVFRDETKRVMRKNKNTKAPISNATKGLVSAERSNDQSSTTRSILPERSYRLEIETPTNAIIPSTTSFLPSITLPLSHSLEERAKVFFIQTQLTNPTPHLPAYSILHSLRSNEPIFLPLVYAARAVSLLYFSNHHHSLSITRTAHQNYLAALKQVQDQISDTEGARHDFTLIAVLFLSAFEKLASSTEQLGCGQGGEATGGFKQAVHLDGALALIKFRGKRQFERWIGMSLFQQLSSAVLTSCLERDVEVPAQFAAMRKVAARSGDTSGVRWRFEQIVVRFISFRVELKAGKAWDNQSGAVSRDLDYECTELYDDLQTIGVETTPSPLSSNKASNLGNTHSENPAASQRFLHHLSIIRLVLAEITPTTPPATSTPPNAREDIFALCNTIYTFATTSPSTRTSLFPLYAAARSRFCPLDLKKRIGALLAREQAMQVMQLLSNKEKENAVAALGNGSRGGSREECGMGDLNMNPWKEFAEGGLGELTL